MGNLLNQLKKLQTVKGKYFFDTKLPKDSYFYFKKMYDGHRFDSIAEHYKNTQNIYSLNGYQIL